MHLQLDSVLNAQALSVFEASSHGLEMYAQCSAYMQDCQLLKCVGSAVFALTAVRICFVCVCACVYVCVSAGLIYAHKFVEYARLFPTLFTY